MDMVIDYFIRQTSYLYVLPTAVPTCAAWIFKGSRIQPRDVLPT